MKPYNIKLKYCTSFVLIYLLFIGSIDKLIRILLVSDHSFSLLLLYINTLFMAMFFGSILIILKILLPEVKPSKLIKHLSKYFWILSLNPIVSYLIYGDVPRNFVFSNGINLLLLVFVLSIIIVPKYFSKLGLIKSSTLSFTIIALYVPIYLVNRVSLLIHPSPTFEVYEIFRFDLFLQSGWTYGLLLNQQHHLLLVLLLIETFLIYSLLAYFTLEDTFREIINSIRTFRTLHFVMMVILGVIFVGTIAEEHSLSLTSINHLPYIFLPALCLVLLWQLTTLLNDLYDLEIDAHVHPERPLVSGNLDRSLYMDMFVSAALLSSFISILLGPFLFFLNSSAILLAILYSVPPMRLRDRVYGHICVGLGSAIAFLFGVYSPSSWTHGLYLTSQSINRNISFYPSIFQVSLLIIVVLSISPLINALSDYEGDLRTGVKNVYTVLGFEKGKKIVSFFIVILFSAPLILFHTLLDFLFLFSLGIISSIIFYKFEDHRPVFGMYFLVLLYLISRFLSFI